MRFQQLKRDPNSVMRKKLVKSKKAWVVVSSLSIAGGLLMMTAPNYVAKADVTTAAPTTQTETTPSSTGTTSSDSSTTASTTSAPATDTTDSGSKTTNEPTTQVDNSTGNKGTEITTDANSDNTTKTADASSTTKEDTTVESTPVSETSETPTTTATNTPTVKTAAFLAAAPAGTTDTGTPVTDDSAAKTTVTTPADTTSTDVTKDSTTTVDTSSLATYNLMTVAPTAATLSADALAAEAVVAPVTPVAEVTTVKTNSGNGWNYNSTNTTLNITGQLDEGDGTDKDRWGGNTSDITAINITPSTADPITAPKNSSYLFANMTNLATISGLDKLDTSNTSNMQGMFKNDSTITNIDLSSNVLNAATDISHMFENDSKLGNVDIASGIASTDSRPGKPFKKLTNASYAFANDVELTNVDSLKSWQGWYLSDLSGMFKNDAKITSLNLSNLMWTMMGTKPNTGDSSVGEGMFDGTNLQSITLSPALSFSPNTALTSTSGGQWVSNVGDISGKSFNFLGVPSINATGTATGGIGALYTGAKVSGDINLTYNATKLATGTTVSNLITINTNHGPISFIAQGTVGQTSTVNVPDKFTFEDGNTYTRTSDPTVQVTFDQTQATAPGEATYVGAEISNGKATISTNDGDKEIDNITGHVGDTVTVIVPSKTGYTPDKTTVSGVIQPDGSVKITDSVTYTGNPTTTPYVTSLGDSANTSIPISLPKGSKVGDKVTVTVPDQPGYTTNVHSIEGTINTKGEFVPTKDPGAIYTGNPTTTPYETSLGDSAKTNVPISLPEGSKVGDKVTVTVPDQTGYTKNVDSIEGTINTKGEFVPTTDPGSIYTGNPTTTPYVTSLGDSANTSIPISLPKGSKVGDKVTVTVPDQTGYTTNVHSIEGTINTKGEFVPTIDPGAIYTGISTSTPYETSLGDSAKTNVPISLPEGSKVGDKVTVTVPDQTGYTTNVHSIEGTINTKGEFVPTTDPGAIYTGILTSTPYVTSLGDSANTPIPITLPKGSKVGDKVTVTVPNQTGYTTNVHSIEGTINTDGKFVPTTDPGAIYTGISTSTPYVTSLGDSANTSIPISLPKGSKVGDKVTVTVPDRPGYTTNVHSIEGTINTDGVFVPTTDPGAIYTGISTSAPYNVALGTGGNTTNISIPEGSKVGDKVTVTVPDQPGYTTNVHSIEGTINTDGKFVPTTDPGTIYTGKPALTDPYTVALGNSGDTVPITIPTDAKVGDNIKLPVPAKDGYATNENFVTGTINIKGEFVPDKVLTYTGTPNSEQTLTVKNPNGSTSNLVIPAGNYGDGPVTVTALAIAGYKAPSVTVTYNASGIPTITDATNTGKSISTTDDLTYTKNPSRSSSYATPVVPVTVAPVSPSEGVIEHKVQTISTYGDQPNVDIYQLDSDNNMIPITNYVLDSDSNWYSDAVTTRNGVNYYRIATNEWAKISQVYPYQELNNLHVRTYDDSEKDLYRSENDLIKNETLAPDSSWLSDRETYAINDSKYYRVATDKFVNSADVYVYEPVQMVVTTHDTTRYTKLYTAKGELITNRSLSRNTAWSVDSITYIKGEKYYRVATNEFVKASDVDGTY